MQATQTLILLCRDRLAVLFVVMVTPIAPRDLLNRRYDQRDDVDRSDSDIRNDDWVAQADQRHCEQLVDDLNDKQCLCPSGDVAIEKMQGDQSCAGEQNGCVDRRKYPSRRHIGAPSKFCRLAVRANRDQHRDEYKDV